VFGVWGMFGVMGRLRGIITKLGYQKRMRNGSSVNKISLLRIISPYLCNKFDEGSKKWDQDEGIKNKTLGFPFPPFPAFARQNKARGA